MTDPNDLTPRAAEFEREIAQRRADPSFPARSVDDPDRVREFAIEAARSLVDDKCEQVLILDVTELSQVTDFVVIGSGTSDRQMNAALSHLEELGKGRGFECWRSSKDDRSTWLLADFVDVVVHLFEPNARAHYDLEMLWGDAPRLEPPRREPRIPPGGVE